MINCIHSQSTTYYPSVDLVNYVDLIWLRESSNDFSLSYYLCLKKANCCCCFRFGLFFFCFCFARYHLIHMNENDTIPKSIRFFFFSPMLGTEKNRFYLFLIECVRVCVRVSVGGFEYAWHEINRIKNTLFKWKCWMDFAWSCSFLNEMVKIQINFQMQAETSEKDRDVERKRIERGRSCYFQTEYIWHIWECDSGVCLSAIEFEIQRINDSLE